MEFEEQIAIILPNSPAKRLRHTVVTVHATVVTRFVYCVTFATFHAEGKREVNKERLI